MISDERVKRVADSCTEQVHILFPRSLNSDGRLYGGQLLGWLDEIAAVVARRHCGGGVVTASIDHMDFKAGAKLGDTVYIRGYLTYVGNSSMEVRTDCYVENMADGTRHMINTAYFVMIALDAEGKPVRVPRLELKSISEQAEWAAGEKRQALRKQRTREGI
ncbi:MAG: acyl-CoA thioesterase [Blautia sp.]|nr:acyl-CoA thioesterase [Blautia sp.]